MKLEHQTQQKLRNKKKPNSKTELLSSKRIDLKHLKSMVETTNPTHQTCNSATNPNTTSNPDQNKASNHP